MSPYGVTRPQSVKISWLLVHWPPRCPGSCKWDIDAGQPHAEQEVLDSNISCFASQIKIFSWWFYKSNKCVKYLLSWQIWKQLSLKSLFGAATSPFPLNHGHALLKEFPMKSYHYMWNTLTNSSFINTFSAAMYGLMKYCSNVSINA